MGFKAWETPPDFFKALDEEFHFTLDAAASHENALCKFYLTTEGMFARTYDGEGYIDLALPDQDGLSYPWTGHRVFCNPPYDSSLYQWVEKATKREAEVAVLLLPPDVDVKWYGLLQDQFYDRTFTSLQVFGKTRWRGHHNSDDSFALLTMKGRLRFWHPALRIGFRMIDYTQRGEDIFDYSNPHVSGDSPRAGNLLAIFRR